MAEGKAQFAAVPRRAISDDRLTDRDFRILAAVASFDRMSSVRGKGQGAWASHATMAELAGAEYSRFSVSINKLLGLDYLVREPLVTDRRKFTYRIVYNAGDSLPPRKGTGEQTVCPSANDRAEDSLPESQKTGEIVCRAPELSSGETTKSPAQYISLSEGIGSAKAEPYSAEAVKINSVETARFDSARLGKIEFEDNVGAQLASLERSLDANAPINAPAWDEWLTQIIENEVDERARGRAMRLSERVIETMSEEEYAQWGLTHGWVDEDGEWHAPHLREVAG